MIKFDSPIRCAAAELRKSSNCKTEIHPNYKQDPKKCIEKIIIKG